MTNGSKEMHEEKEKAIVEKTQPNFLIPIYTVPNCTHTFDCRGQFMNFLPLGHRTVRDWSIIVQLYYEEIGICGLNYP